MTKISCEVENMSKYIDGVEGDTFEDAELYAELIMSNCNDLLDIIQRLKNMGPLDLTNLLTNASQGGDDENNKEVLSKPEE
jgi:hypothetical protein